MSTFVIRVVLQRRSLGRAKSSSVEFSTTVNLMSERNKPRNSGDKGPERNFQKKIMRKANKDVFMSSDVLKNLKVTESTTKQSSGVEDNLQ